MRLSPNQCSNAPGLPGEEHALTGDGAKPTGRYPSWGSAGAAGRELGAEVLGDGAHGRGQGSDQGEQAAQPSGVNVLGHPGHGREFGECGVGVFDSQPGDLDVLGGQ